MRKKPPAGDRSRIEKPESEKDLQFVELARDPEIRDALSPVTRNERRALLGASFVALAITLGGLIPERISAFDVEISATAQSKLLLLLAGVLAYFILAFLLYGYSDYRAWILAIGAVNRSRK